MSRLPSPLYRRPDTEDEEALAQEALAFEEAVQTDLARGGEYAPTEDEAALFGPVVPEEAPPTPESPPSGTSNDSEAGAEDFDETAYAVSEDDAALFTAPSRYPEAPPKSGKDDEEPQSAKFIRGAAERRKQLEQERQWLDSLSEEDPMRRSREPAWADQWGDLQRIERAIQYGMSVKIGNNTLLDDPVYSPTAGLLSWYSTIDEAMQVSLGGIKSAWARSKYGGRDHEKAESIDEAVYNLREYTATLAEFNRFFSPAASRAMHSINADLTRTTMEFATPGGVVTKVMFPASMEAMSTHSRLMHEGKQAGLSLEDRVIHANVGAGITFGTMALGTALAKYYNVARGDDLLQAVGARTNQLATTIGAKQLGIAAALNGGENAFEDTMHRVNDWVAGLNDESLLENAMGIGISGLVGSLLGGAIEGASQIDKRPLVQHFSDTLQGWLGRMRSRPVTPDAPSTKSKYVKGSEGQPISRSVVENDLAALIDLEAELREAPHRQATKLRQEIDDRAVHIAEVETVLADVEARVKQAEHEIEQSYHQDPRVLGLKEVVREREGTLNALKQEEGELLSQIRQLEQGEAAGFFNPETLDIFPTDMRREQQLALANREARLLEVRRDLNRQRMDQLTDRAELSNIRRQFLAERPENPVAAERRQWTEYLDELRAKQEVDTETYTAWPDEFDTIHAKEMEWVNSEIERISQMAEQDYVPPRDEVNKAPGGQEQTPAREKRNTSEPAEPEIAPKEPIPNTREVEQTPADRAQKNDPTHKTEPQSPMEELRGLADMRRETQNRIRKLLDEGPLPSHEKTTQNQIFDSMLAKGLDQKWPEFFERSKQGETLTAEESATLLFEQVSRMDQVEADARKLTDELTEFQWDEINNRIEDNRNMILELSEQIDRQGSLAGTRLNFQKAALGVAFSPQRAYNLATREKRRGKKPMSTREVNKLKKQGLSDAAIRKMEADRRRLTPEQMEKLDGLSEQVKEAGEKHQAAEKEFGRGSKEERDAYANLAQAQVEWGAGILNMRDKRWITEIYDTVNSGLTGWVLSFDGPPIFRQGGLDLLRRPFKTIRNTKTWFSNFAKGTAEDARKMLHLVNRDIKEDPWFDIVNEGGQFRLYDARTPYTEMEGTVIGRFQSLFEMIPGHKIVDRVAPERFELAFKAWMNKHRFELMKADLMRTESIWSSLPPDARKAEIAKYTEMTMKNTGHENWDAGVLHKVMVAPKWAMNRLFAVPRSLYYMTTGGASRVFNGPNARSYRAAEHAKMWVNATAIPWAAATAASMILGEENVSFDPLTGELNVMGQKRDLSMGTRTSLRVTSAMVRGAQEVLSQGSGSRKDAVDVNYTFGNGFFLRAYPSVKFLAYTVERASGRDERGVIEFFGDMVTPLPVESITSELQEQGASPRMIYTILGEIFGANETEFRDKKRKPKPPKRKLNAPF